MQKYRKMNMKKHVFRIIGLVLIVSACIGVYMFMKPNPMHMKANSWETYLKKTLDWSRRPFIVSTLSKIPSPKEGAIALDMGAGAGNETLLLLGKGFDVIAIDSEKVAFDLMLKRPEIIKHQGRLKTIQSNFQNLDFESLPLVDVVVASFSIPFCPPKYFDRFWQDLVSKIKPGGYFVGNTFSLESGSYFIKRKNQMTFHNDKQTIDLFKDFNIISKTKDAATFESYMIFAQKKQ